MLWSQMHIYKSTTYVSDGESQSAHFGKLTILFYCFTMKFFKPATLLILAWIIDSA